MITFGCTKGSPSEYLDLLGLHSDHDADPETQCFSAGSVGVFS